MFWRDSTPKIFKVSAIMLDSYTSEDTGFSFAINQQVDVTEYFIPEFSVSTFLAELGGSIGLWLGVGAVQLLSNGVHLINWI